VKPRLLDLFCGAGGAAMGYYRAGFEVVGVDIAQQKNYPFEFHQADAMAFPLEGFDAIHASPPCQAYVQRNKNLVTKHPRLIAPTRDRLQKTGLPYVIENVEGSPLIWPMMLCGTMFGLPLRRHRLFESNAELRYPRNESGAPLRCNHWGTVAHGQFAAVYGKGGKGPRRGAGVRDAGPLPGAPTWEDAMGIDWMSAKELTQAIPPAYTEHIGKHLMAALIPEGIE